jgi:hypothetical protein
MKNRLKRKEILETKYKENIINNLSTDFSNTLMSRLDMIKEIFQYFKY